MTGVTDSLIIKRNEFGELSKKLNDEHYYNNAKLSIPLMADPVPNK